VMQGCSGVYFELLRTICKFIHFPGFDKNKFVA
jgi:hypothetical protein